MPRERLLSIVLGPSPSHLNPINLEQLRLLVSTREDVGLRVGRTGIRVPEDTVLFDRTGNASGELFLIDGRLQTNTPDDRTIEWMVELARALNGRVVDNSGRTYRSPHEKYVHPDDVEFRRDSARRIAIARNKYIPYTHTIMKWIIIGFFAAMAAVVIATMF